MASKPTDQICLHGYISGRVQGVFFRHGTLTFCTELKLTGWVRNTEDNRVEVMACGPRRQIEKLKAWLAKGPPRAEVSQVDVQIQPYQPFTGFEIR